MRKRASRTEPAERKKQILDYAIYVSGKIGHLNITRSVIAKECGIAGSLIYKYFTSIDVLKKQVFRQAVKQEIIPILAHCISNKEFKIPAKLKQKTIEYLAK